MKQHKVISDFIGLFPPSVDMPFLHNDENKIFYMEWYHNENNYIILSFPYKEPNNIAWQWCLGDDMGYNSDIFDDKEIPEKILKKLLIFNL